MVERWKPVLGYEGFYRVSDRGRTRRIAVASNTYVGRILRVLNDHNGYPVVHLCRDNRRKHRTVHSLVAEAFLGPRPDGKQVNHKNGIKTDNRVANLEYVTPRENTRHSLEVLGRKAAHGEAKSQAKLTTASVREIRRLYAEGGITQCELAERHGVSQVAIWDVLHRRTWAHVA